MLFLCFAQLFSDLWPLGVDTALKKCNGTPRAFRTLRSASPGSIHHFSVSLNVTSYLEDRKIKILIY